MSQILKAVLLAAYCALIFHFLRTLYRNKDEEIQITYITRPRGSLKKIMREIRKSKNDYTIVDMKFRTPIRLPTDLKYILKWTESISHYSMSALVTGQSVFIDNKCTFYNCYITSEKGYLTDPRFFDAILFDAENSWDYHPIIRTPRQKYIFTASEPASMHPICHPAFDSYYNWTWTYKLDSNIVKPFFSIYHKNGTLAGPKLNMTWITNTKNITPKLSFILSHKKKMAAWFVSYCKTKSEREKIVEGLIKALNKYNFTVDTYGWCGEKVCRLEDCLQMLKTDYYFYLAFEHSVNEDYVSEKVLYALNYNTVPIVFGGANYSRFLPPNSYIDARTMDSASLASLMIEISNSPFTYDTYFRWREHYYFKTDPATPDVCKLCELLNKRREHSVINNFNKWWSADACKDGKTREILPH